MLYEKFYSYPAIFVLFCSLSMKKNFINYCKYLKMFQVINLGQKDLTIILTDFTIQSDNRRSWNKYIDNIYPTKSEN